MLKIASVVFSPFFGGYQLLGDSVQLYRLTGSQVLLPQHGNHVVYSSTELDSQISLVNGDCWKGTDDDDCNELHGKPVESEDVNQNKVMKEFTKERRRHQNRRGECHF